MMEKRLIDANALIAEYDRVHIGPAGGARKLMEDAPTVDAVEVRCNVGNWVYALWNVPTKDKYIIYCAEVKEIRIAKRNSRITTTYILEPIEYRGRKKEYRDDDFGKLVFINEEDAKVALEERRSDGKID